MTLPVETAEQTRRLLLEMCYEHVRKAVEAVREICLMLKAYQNGNEAEVLQHHNAIVKIESDSTELKRALMKELAQVGMVLLSREDFFRLSSEISTITDYSEGVSFRLFEFASRKWRIGNELLKDLSQLAEATLECVIRLRETVLSLTYGGAKTLELAKNVESAERVVDSIYRKVELRIVNSDTKIPIIFMLRDVAQFLEGIADVSENANDVAKILAITM